MTLNLRTFYQVFFNLRLPLHLFYGEPSSTSLTPKFNTVLYSWGDFEHIHRQMSPSSFNLFVVYFSQDFSFHFVSFFFSFVHYWVNSWVITHLSSHCLEPGSSNHHLTALKWTWATRASTLVLEHKVLTTIEINISGVNWEFLLLVTMRQITGSAMHLRASTFFLFHQLEAGLTCK